MLLGSPSQHEIRAFIAADSDPTFLVPVRLQNQHSTLKQSSLMHGQYGHFHLKTDLPRSQFSARLVTLLGFQNWIQIRFSAGPSFIAKTSCIKLPQFSLIGPSYLFKTLKTFGPCNVVCLLAPVTARRVTLGIQPFRHSCAQRSGDPGISSDSLGDLFLDEAYIDQLRLSKRVRRLDVHAVFPEAAPDILSFVGCQALENDGTWGKLPRIQTKDRGPFGGSFQPSKARHGSESAGAPLGEVGTDGIGHLFELTPSIWTPSKKTLNHRVETDTPEVGIRRAGVSMWNPHEENSHLLDKMPNQSSIVGCELFPSKALPPPLQRIYDFRVKLLLALNSWSENGDHCAVST